MRLLQITPTIVEILPWPDKSARLIVDTARRVLVAPGLHEVNESEMRAYVDSLNKALELLNWSWKG